MILTSLIFYPFFSSILLAFTNHKWASRLGPVLSIIYFIFSLSLFFVFDSHSSDIQLSQNIPWVPSLGIHYFVGIDGISFWFVLLTALLLPLCVLGSVLSVKKHLSGFLSCLFLLTGFVEGSFLALDSVLFYIFFEGSLLPLFFLILIWGGKEKTYAGMKFFIYTALGSFFMLTGILSLIFLTKGSLGYFSASLLDFYKLNIPFIGGFVLSPQSLLFLTFVLAFAVKTPLIPFHTWLPLAHVEAPTAGSVFLAAVVLKMGAYGFLRFVLPLFPEASSYYAPWLCFLSAGGIIYGAFMALAQKDLKKLIAYSSVSHVGYIVLGFFVFNSYALSGGVLQMFTHGLSSASLFFLVGMIYDRTHTKDISQYGGLASSVPVYSVLFFLSSLSAIALPLTGGFISEFLVLMGVFLSQPEWLPLAITGVILGASYMLLLILKVFFGPTGKIKSIPDLTFKEQVVVAPLIILIFVVGVQPNYFFKYSKTSLDHLLNNRFQYKLHISKKSQKLFHKKQENQ